MAKRTYYCVVNYHTMQTIYLGPSEDKMATILVSGTVQGTATSRQGAERAARQRAATATANLRRHATKRKAKATLAAKR